MKADRRPLLPLPLLRFWAARVLPIWCLIALMIFLFQILICGIVHDNEKVKIFLQFIDMLPAIVKMTLGGEGLQVGNVSGLVAIGYQHPLVLVLYMLFAVGVPTGLLAGEVQNGTMELILSRQATKLHVYACAGIIAVTGMLALVLVMFLGTVAGTRLYDFAQDVSLRSFFIMAIVAGVFASAVGGIALLSAASFRRNTAVWVTVAYLVVNYFVSIAAEWWPRMEWLSPATIFTYVDSAKILTESAWPAGDLWVLMSIFVVSVLLGGVIWSRRDLPL